MESEKLTIEELTYIQNEVKIKGKNIFIAYMLTFTLNLLGVHRFYLGKRVSAVIKAITTVIAVTTLYLIVSTATTLNLTSQAFKDALSYNTILAITSIISIMVTIFWSVLDLFLVSNWVDEFNDKTKVETAKKTIQARYFAEQLLSDKISEHIVAKAKEEAIYVVITEIKLMLENLDLDKVMKENNLVSSGIPTLPEDNLDAYKEITDILQEEAEPDIETTYEDHEDQVSMDLLTPDAIAEEVEVDVETIPEYLTDLIKESKVEASVDLLRTELSKLPATLKG